MPFNGSGIFNVVYNFVNDAANGIKILASRQDTQWADVATNGLSNVICKDGQSVTTAAIPFAAGVKTDTLTEKTVNAGITAMTVVLGTQELQITQSGDSGFAFNRYTATANIGQSSTTDIFRFLNLAGGVVGNAGICGRFDIQVVDQAASSNTSVYELFVAATSNGVTNSNLDTILLTTGGLSSTIVRGTALVTGFALAADGGLGSVKLRLTTAASGKTVIARVAFTGLVV